MKALFLIYASTLVSTSAFAMFGTGVVDGGPSSACSIVGQYPLDTSEGIVLSDYSICTGTLVSETEVRTAAHCVELFSAPDVPRGSVVKISCGYDSKTQKFKAIRYANRLLISKNRQGFETDGDGASIQFDRAIPKTLVEPMPVATNAEGIIELLTGGGECRVSGFGLSASGGIGRLKSGEVDGRAFKLRPKADSIESVNERSKKAGDAISGSATLYRAARPVEGFPDTYMIHDDEVFSKGAKSASAYVAALEANFPSLTFVSEGDSGGPLYCRQDASGPYQLVGIHVGAATNLHTSKTANGTPKREVDSVTRHHFWSFPNPEMRVLKTY